MKYCNNCKVKYESDIKNCVLCSGELIDLDNNHNKNFPEYKSDKKIVPVLYKIFIILNLISISISMFIDYVTSKNLDWSLLVSVSNVYLVILFKVFINKNTAVVKIIKMLFLTILEIVAIAFLSNDYNWAIDITLPFILITNSIILTISILVKRKNWIEYIPLLSFSIFLNVMVIFLNIFGVTKTRWAIYVSFFYGLFTSISFLIFSPKDIKEEMLRRFHM